MQRARCSLGSRLLSSIALVVHLGAVGEAVESGFDAGARAPKNDVG
jgi:hypothetical protein